MKLSKYVVLQRQGCKTSASVPIGPVGRACPIQLALLFAAVAFAAEPIEVQSQHKGGICAARPVQGLHAFKLLFTVSCMHAP